MQPPHAPRLPLAPSLVLRRLCGRLAPVIMSLAFAAWAGPAWAADLVLETRIDRVTLFPDGAMVTRIGPVDLPAGASTLTIRGLPATLDPGSIRIEGEGTGGFALGAIDVRRAPGEARPALDPNLEARIKAMREERDTGAARLAALEVKKGAIERYAQASPERLGDQGRPLDVAQWNAAWDAVGTALARVNEEIRAGQSRQRELDAEIAALERARPRAAGGAPVHDVAIAVETSAPTKGRVAITYRVTGANWRPLYDARLDTGGGKAGAKPSLEWVRRAEVTQRTGEDWTGVALTVSTLRATRGTAAPDVPPMQVGLRDPIQIERETAARRANEMMAMSARGRLEDAAKVATAPAAPAAAAEPVAATETEAKLEAGAYQASFAVPGRVDVPRDGTAKSLRLGSQTLTPALFVKTAPAIDPTAYLSAAFTPEGEAALLPGEVMLHRDGAFVGRGRIGLVPAGEKAELGFGADEKVTVTRAPVRRVESEPSFLGSSRSDLHDYRIQVKNLHPFPVAVTVTDRVPFSETNAITVETLPQTTPPSLKQVEDKRGVMAWSFDLPPGADREIRLAYRLRWPADRDLVPLPAPRPLPMPVR